MRLIYHTVVQEIIRIFPVECTANGNTHTKIVFNTVDTEHREHIYEITYINVDREMLTHQMENNSTKYGEYIVYYGMTYTDGLSEGDVLKEIISAKNFNILDVAEGLEEKVREIRNTAEMYNKFADSI